MKVKGIMFFGVMGAILMSATANAAPAEPLQVASTKYVERRVAEELADVAANIDAKADKDAISDMETKTHASQTYATQESVGNLAAAATAMGVAPADANVADLILKANAAVPDLTGYATEGYADSAASTAADAAESAAKKHTDDLIGDTSTLTGTRYGAVAKIVDALGVTDEGLSNIEAKIATMGDVANLTTEAKGSLVAAINEVAGKAADNSDYTELAGRVTTAEGKIDVNAGKIGENTSAITAAGEKISANEGKITAIDGRVTTAEGTIAGQGTRLTTAEGTITDHGTRLATAEGTIVTHGSDIDGIKGRLTTAEGTIANHGTRLTSVEGVADLASQNAQQALNDIGVISSLNTGEKSSLVGAINELQGALGGVASDENLELLNEKVNTNTTNIGNHIADTVVHVTSTEREAWNAKAPAGDYATNSALNAHTTDTVAHVTSTERDAWNAKADKADIENKLSTHVSEADAKYATKGELGNYAPAGNYATADQLESEVTTRSEADTALQNSITALTNGAIQKNTDNIAANLAAIGAKDSLFTEANGLSGKSLAQAIVDVKNASASGTDVSDLTERVAQNEADIDALQTTTTFVDGEITETNGLSAEKTLAGNLSTVAGLVADNAGKIQANADAIADEISARESADETITGKITITGGEGVDLYGLNADDNLAANVITVAGRVSDLESVQNSYETKANIVTSITEENKASETQYTSVAAVQGAIVGAAGTTTYSADSSYAEGTIGKAIQDAAAAGDMGADAAYDSTKEYNTNTIGSAIKTATNKIWNHEIPQPSQECQTASYRCVLSVDMESGSPVMKWLAVTAPLESAGSGWDTEEGDGTVEGEGGEAVPGPEVTE